MGMFNTYFIAPDDAAAAAVVDDGPTGVHAPVVEAVGATVEAGTLLALLSGETYDSITDDPSWSRLVSSPDHESAWVISMPDTFTEALAASSEDRLAEVATPWSETAEFWGNGDAVQLLSMLQEWRVLAQTARDRGEHMYCWAAL